MKKCCLILLSISIIILLNSCRKKESDLDKILNEAVSEEKQVELSTRNDMLGQPLSYGLVIYNNGREERWFSVNKEKKIGAYTDYEYNESGNLVKTLENTPDGEYLRAGHYIYDEQDRLIKHLDKEREGVHQVHQYYTIYI